jgi:tetrahydromethanopterin S-methyltransferase subunit G
VFGEENQKMNRKVGYKMRKRRENIQNTDQDAAKLRERGNRLDMIEKISFNMSESKQSVVEN